MNLIIFDTATPAFLNNRVFDSDHAALYPEANAITCLSEIAKSNGWAIMTGDLFLKLRPSFERCVCLSQEVSNQTFELARSGLELKLLFSGESPNVSWRFYRNLEKFSVLFKHVYVFRGYFSRVTSGAIFHPFYWPMPESLSSDSLDFEQRNMLVFPASFKERFTLNRNNLFSYLYFPFRSAQILWFQATDQLARFHDLYSRRMEIVKALADKYDFFLMGRNWEVARTRVRSIRNLKFANPPTSFPNKLDVLKTFRFTLAFENCIFPGYVTEKIFDAMLGGSVPIYLGAPDIEDFVPSGCFIDFRQYKGVQEMWEDVSSWSKQEWESTVNRIKDFIYSEQYDVYRQTRVAKQFFDWLTEDN